MTGNAALITDGGWCVGPDGAARTLDGAGQAPCGCGPSSGCCSNPRQPCAWAGSQPLVPFEVYIDATFQSVRTQPGNPTQTTVGEFHGNVIADCDQAFAIMPRFRNGTPLTPVQFGVNMNNGEPFDGWQRSIHPAGFPVVVAIDNISLSAGALGSQWRVLSQLLPSLAATDLAPTVTDGFGSILAAQIMHNAHCLTTMTAHVDDFRNSGGGIRIVTDFTMTISGPAFFACSGSDCADCDNSDLEPA